ncbi:SDR family oxidoreductase [Pseudomonas sp. SJZ131]|uniref:dTDP-4-dehydrorhamnose reductase family protein n=1 Tax=Pseudomonas sp. SJZ131 TaxID=2572895 RepID=UPI00119B96CC|nr:SDR family oxidoreductase [Pseudomonas sp. SJZ131]TWD44503.1 dTDP-4-dehydrorhamnose reductase [Pseudomonas sp. SJZ131]
MKILVLGATGMLGSTMFRQLFGDERYDVWGTTRSPSALVRFSEQERAKLLSNVDVLDADQLISVFNDVKPDAVINCIGLIKQLSTAKDPMAVLPINSLLPHRLSKICELSNARLVQISTDCVFSGRKGMYTEADVSDAEDIYGKSKFLGEVVDSKLAVTLRTSIIGHELNSTFSLVDWFLSQSGSVKGFAKAIFSGLPTVELARVIRDFVLPNPELSGLYQVAASPIDKYSLLKQIASIYEKKIEIVRDESLVIDRSLDPSKFKAATGYVAPSWADLIDYMHRTR